jgi:hypothetical protein
MRQGEVCYLRRPGGAPVSALIGVLRKAVQAERQPYSGALLQHLETTLQREIAVKMSL